MLSRPDFMTKQLILIESDTSKKIRFRNHNLVLSEEGKTLLQHSCHKIFLVYVVGEFTITSVLIKNAKKFAFPIIFLNYNLKQYHSVIPDNKGNFLLRKKQYLSEKDLFLAKHIIHNKITNQIRLLLSKRYKSEQDKISLSKLRRLILAASNCYSSQELLGVEGTASKIFFSAHFKNTPFSGRRPRTKDDISNLLLDIGYFYLFNFVEAHLELYGFDVYYGFHHKLFFQRKSLVCDIIEPFRCIIDRKLLKAYNLKQIDENDFFQKNNQYFIKREFNKKYSQLFIKEILAHKEEIFLYVQSFYRAFINDKKEFPRFEI